ncbi:MAG TPA: hypothetical protein VIH29_11945 [Gallionella sp.]
MMLATTINEALREVVQALGGARKVGVMMRPEKSAKDAARWISDCLNVERREKFDPEQVMWLLREGRNIGCHSAMYFVGREAGYAVEAIEPLDEMAELQRQFIDASKGLSKMAERIESLAKITTARTSR